MRGDKGALLRAQAQVLGGAVVDERTGLIGPKVLRGQQVRDGKLSVGGEVAEQADVAVGEGAEDEGAAEVVQRVAAIAPGFEVVPDPANGVELVGVPEAGEVVVGQQTDEGVVVVLVDGLEGVFALRAGGERGGVGFGKDLVGVAPFLGEVGPGDGGGEEANGRGEGGGLGGVESVGGLLVKGLGDRVAPVDEGAKDLLGTSAFLGWTTMVLRRKDWVCTS